MKLTTKQPGFLILFLALCLSIVGCGQMTDCTLKDSSGTSLTLHNGSDLSSGSNMGRFRMDTGITRSRGAFSFKKISETSGTLNLFNGEFKTLNGNWTSSYGNMDFSVDIKNGKIVKIYNSQSSYSR